MELRGRRLPTKQAHAAAGAPVDAPARGPRVLYKLAGGTHAARFQVELHAMASGQGQASGGRRLRGAGDAPALHFQSLGQLAGLGMVQLPHGEAADWLLQALQSHPGTSPPASPSAGPLCSCLGIQAAASALQR